MEQSTTPRESVNQLAKDIDAIREIVSLMCEVVKAAGPHGIPSGHLYAQLLGHMNIATYTKLIEIMVQAGNITITNHVIRYVPR